MGNVLSHPYQAAMIGGLLIGLAAALLMMFDGRVAGISGIFYESILNPFKEKWRLGFLAGLFSGAILILLCKPELLDNSLSLPAPALIAAGLLVGFGTRLGGGCTSGHGVCGTSRLSVRSIAATVTFLVIGILTATLIGKLGLV